MQLFLECRDFLHIFVAIRFGRQVVAVDSLNNIIYIELAVREDGEFFYAGMREKKSKRCLTLKLYKRIT